MNDHIEVLRQLLREAVPYLRDAGEPFEDDGSNEPLELSRRIEDALESDAALAAMGGHGDGRYPCPRGCDCRGRDCPDCANFTAPHQPAAVKESCSDAAVSNRGD